MTAVCPDSWRARELAERYGERFTPPALLVEKAEKSEGERFGDN